MNSPRLSDRTHLEVLSDRVGTEAQVTLAGARVTEAASAQVNVIHLGKLLHLCPEIAGVNLH